MAVGRIEWIGRAPAARAVIETLSEAELLAGLGIQGDYHALSAPGGKRQVTLIQTEHLREVADLLRRPVTPDLCRRNLVVAGLELAPLGGRRLRAGTALLEVTGDCTPCRRMEENLGRGGLAAMRGRGGVTARVLEDGRIRLGDEVRVEPA
jgi:MOSC domain-containing protein YiiM